MEGIDKMRLKYNIIDRPYGKMSVERVSRDNIIHFTVKVKK